MSTAGAPGSGLALTFKDDGDGLLWPTAPAQASPEDRREHLKERLAVGFRIFSMFGFDMGIAGHISARDPILKDHFWVNPVGLHFSRMRVSDLVMVDHEGRLVHGDKPINAAAYGIHAAIHRARPDVIAAAHAHARFSTAFASLGIALPPITQEGCVFYGDHGVFQGYRGVAADLSEGEMISESLGQKKAVICRNHGIFTVGHSVDEAVNWFLRLERSCEQYLLAKSAGTPVEIDHETALLAARQVGSHEAGWYGLQPLVDKIIAEQPEVLA
jgi:ribulose-5-phosphate 4-epimerase/fuculose-1-phosphate aldolase